MAVLKDDFVESIFARSTQIEIREKSDVASLGYNKLLFETA